MSDNKTLKPSSKILDSSDIGQNVANFLSTAAVIGTLTAGGGEPPKQANPANNEAKSSHALKVARNTGASLVGGGVSAAILAKLRGRRTKQEKEHSDGRSL